MRWLWPLLVLLLVIVPTWWVFTAWWIANQEETAGAVTTIVLVTPDTLRQDRVGLYGRDRETTIALTPELDALGAAGLRFDDARTPVPLTLPAHTTMLTGLPPAATGVRVNAHGRIPDAGTRGFPLLAERLAEAGWATGAFVSAAPLASHHGLDQGFDRYDDEGLEDLTTLAYPERPGEETVERALAWIDEVGDEARVFLWVHLFEPHAPYAPAAPAGTPLDVRYDLDVAEVDRVIGVLLDGLEARGRGPARRAVLVTSDHGEALDELGERTHGILLGDAVLRVPLLLAAPGLAPGVRADPVDVADVAPTLARLADLPWPTAAADGPGRGRDLLAGPAPADRIRVAESLYARQRYRWAQLVAAVAPAGGTLVDAGAERVLWLEPAPFLEPQAAPRPLAAADVPPALTRALVDTLRAYRAGEREDLIEGGRTAWGYGAAGRAEPFLPPEENGRLENPYAVVARAHALDQLAFLVRAGRPPGPLAARLERMVEADPDNPEAWFWLGQARARQGEAEPAEAAFLAAWQGGRRDAGTLRLLCGVNAVGREAAMLERLRRLRGEVAPDTRLHLLEARLAAALERPEEVAAACRAAAAAARTERDAEALEAAREDGTCR